MINAGDLRPGMLIRGSYRIVGKLGEGGFGAVYLAEHTLMENELRALKFLSGQWSSDKELIARFRREVRTLRQVRHPNVVDCGDLEQAEDGSLFFAMEYVRGPDLRRFLVEAARPLDVSLAVDLTRGVAEGLGAAHRKEMVHRDVKPENILLQAGNKGNVPKIVDFGIVATRESSTLTRTGQSFLTMAYAAPEQWRGTPAAELDGRTDLYALGGILYEMLTGRTPFQADSYEGWMQRHLNENPIPPSALRRDLNNWVGLDLVVMRMLAKDRNDRPRDVAELLRLLDGVRPRGQAARPTVVKQQDAGGPRRPPIVLYPKRPAGFWYVMLFPIGITGAVAFSSYLNGTLALDLITYVFGAGMILLSLSTFVVLGVVGSDLRLDESGFAWRWRYRKAYLQWDNVQSFFPVEVRQRPNGKANTVGWRLQPGHEAQKSRIRPGGCDGYLPLLYGGKTPEELAGLMNEFRSNVRREMPPS